MARFVEIIGNICYGTGLYLQIGEKYDLDDTALNEQVKRVLEEQLANGRTVRFCGSANTFRQVGIKRAPDKGVTLKNHIPVPVVHETGPADVAESADDTTANEKAAEEAVRSLKRRPLSR